MKFQKRKRFERMLPIKSSQIKLPKIGSQVRFHDRPDLSKFNTVTDPLIPYEEQELQEGKLHGFL